MVSENCENASALHFLFSLWPCINVILEVGVSVSDCKFVSSCHGGETEIRPSDQLTVTERDQDLPGARLSSNKLGQNLHHLSNGARELFSKKKKKKERKKKNHRKNETKKKPTYESCPTKLEARLSAFLYWKCGWAVFIFRCTRLFGVWPMKCHWWVSVGQISQLSVNNVNMFIKSESKTTLLLQWGRVKLLGPFLSHCASSSLPRTRLPHTLPYCLLLVRNINREWRSVQENLGRVLYL